MKLSAEVQDVLQRCRVDGSRLTLPGQLDKNAYKRVNAALELMGGKWNRKAKAHLFEDDSAEAAVADAIATGTVLDVKKAFQFFETPPAVAKQLVDLAELEPGMSVLEPSAGRGALIREIRMRGCEPVACELWDKNREALKALGVVVVADDFLAMAPGPRRGFDRGIMNPPFTRGQDIAHVTHMFELLKPGGRLTSIMSPGWTFRDDRRAQGFRELVDSCASDWTDLPEGSFVSSGTSVKTGIIVMERA